MMSLTLTCFFKKFYHTCYISSVPETNNYYFTNTELKRSNPMKYLCNEVLDFFITSTYKIVAGGLDSQ